MCQRLLRTQTKVADVFSVRRREGKLLLSARCRVFIVCSPCTYAAGNELKHVFFVVTLCPAPPQFTPEGTIKVSGFESSAETSCERLFEATFLGGYREIMWLNICSWNKKKKERPQLITGKNSKYIRLLSERFQCKCDSYPRPDRLPLQNPQSSRCENV